MAEPVPDHRAAAMAVLTSGGELRPKEGSFLGQIAFDANPLSERQANWLRILVERYGPSDDDGGVR